MKKYIAPLIDVRIVNTSAMMWDLSGSGTHDGPQEGSSNSIPARKDWKPVF